MDGVDIGYRAGGGGGSSDGERVGNLVRIFILGVNFFE